METILSQNMHGDRLIFVKDSGHVNFHHLCSFSQALSACWESRCEHDLLLKMTHENVRHFRQNEKAPKHNWSKTSHQLQWGMRKASPRRSQETQPGQWVHMRGRKAVGKNRLSADGSAVLCGLQTSVIWEPVHRVAACGCPVLPRDWLHSPR